jgi:hypothetical protein
MAQINAVASMSGCSKGHRHTILHSTNPESAQGKPKDGSLTPANKLNQFQNVILGAPNPGHIIATPQ